MKFDLVMKQLIGLQSVICAVKGNNCSFTGCIKKKKKKSNNNKNKQANNKQKSWHSDIYEQIWFKLGIIIDTTKSYISTLAFSDLDLRLA